MREFSPLFAYFNPYYDSDIFSFFALFFMRLWLLLTGQLSFDEIASDELQVFVLVAVACSSALCGTFLLLRKMAMLANSISHTILVGIVIAFLVTREHTTGGDHHHGAIDIEIMLVASVAMGVLTALFTEFLTKTVRLQEDASTGLVFTTLFAVGIVLATLTTRNAHIGAEVVMGNVDALHVDDLKLIVSILLVNILITTLLFKEYTITTFDPALARALGFSTALFNYLLMVQVSATIVGAFRAVGVLMVLCFITGPTLIARCFTHNLKSLLLLSMAIGSAASLLGVAIARHLLTVNGVALSTAGVTTTTIALLYAAAATWSYRRKGNGLNGRMD